MSCKQRILFVDDEARILRGLRRSLDCMRGEWDMEFANSGQEALDLMAQKPFDVVVSDMRMPGMSGVELLNEVRRLYPQTVRLALSGQSSKESVLNSVGPIHQYLPKPCNTETLHRLLSGLWTLRDLLAVPKLQSLLAQLEHLPSLPMLYKSLMEEFGSPDGSLKSVGRIVAQDMSMSAKVLQLVNSAFFGVPRHVSSPDQAVAVLGLDTVKALAVAVCVFTPFEDAAAQELEIGRLWEHSTVVASFAKQIAEADGADPQTADHAFIAGMLHDVGRLVLAATLPDDYMTVMSRSEEQGIEWVEAEQDVIRATHAQLGGYLLGLWGFSDPVLQAVAFHHDPARGTGDGFSPVVAVHVANVFYYELYPDHAVGRQPTVDHATLCKRGLSERLKTWEQVCRKTIPEGVS